jgi:hypothetical protein
MISYRQELDLLENLQTALQNADDYDNDHEEMVHQIAEDWPNEYYGQRVTQWLQAGQPDIHDTSAEDYVEDITQIIKTENRNNLTQSLHDILGVILYVAARDYMNETIGNIEETEEALLIVDQEIAEHRANVMTHDGHALTPPYQYTILNTYNQTHTVHVTPNN